MSTGSVNPFTPNQPTQNIVNNGTVQTVTFNPCDSLLLFNNGTVAAFVNYGTTVAAASGMPVPGGAQVLIGVPGVAGFDTSQQFTLAAIGASGTLYITPGLGTAL